MTDHLLAVLGAAALCGAWVAVQRWVGRRDPDQPGVEGWSRCERHAHPCRSCGVDDSHQCTGSAECPAEGIGESYRDIIAPKR